MEENKAIINVAKKIQTLLEKAGVSNYGAADDRTPEGIVGENFGTAETQNNQEVKNGALEALEEAVFETTPQSFCVKIAD